MSRKVLALFCIILSLAALGAADPAWEIVDTTFAPMNASDPATGVLFMTVQDVDTGNPIDPGDQGCDTINTKYRYNTSGNQEMEYVPESSGRYYATFPISDANESVSMEAWGDGCDEGDAIIAAEANVSFDTTNNQSVRILNTSTRRGLLEDHSYTFGANVTYNGSVEQDTTINWTLYDLNGDPAAGVQMNSGTTNYTPELGYYNSSIQMPSTGDRLYYLVFESGNSSLGYANASGADAQLLQVNETIEASMSVRNNNSYCNTADDPSECQEGAMLQSTFNITQSQAANVTGWIEAGEHNLTNLTMTEISDSVWQANYTLPQSINTTKYGLEYNITIQATNELDRLTKRHTLSLQPYRIFVQGIGSKPQGSTARLYFRQEYPYAETPIVRSQTDMFEVSIYYENGTELMNETIGNGTSIGSDYRAGASSLLEGFVYGWDIPSDAPLEEYTMELNVTDIYGIEKDTLHFPSDTTASEVAFQVYNSSASSDVEITDASLTGTNDDDTGATETFSTPQNVSGSIVLKNNGGQSADVVDISARGNISSVLNYTIDNHDAVPFTIEEDTNDVIDLEFNLHELGEYDGEVIFEIDSDRDYNRTFDIDYTVEKDCELSNETFCTEESSIDLRYTGSADEAYNLTVSNLEGAVKNITASPEGNISTFFSDQRINLTGYQTEEMAFDLPIGDDDEGNYSGDLLLNDTSASTTLQIPTEVEVDIPEGSLNLTVNGSTDLGTVATSDTRSITFVLDNTGPVTLENLSIVSPDLGLDTQLSEDDAPVTLDPDEQYNTSLSVGLGQLDPGEYTSASGITVYGRSASGVEDSVTLTATVQEDLSDEIAALQNDLERLRTQLSTYESDIDNTTSQAIQNRLDQLESTIQEAETANENGNYAEAESLLSDARDSRDTAQSRLNTAVGTGQTEDAGDTNGTTPNGGNETTDGTGGGGGFNPLLIIVPLIIIVVVGVILYLSIVPEDEEAGGQPDYSSPPGY